MRSRLRADAQRGPDVTSSKDEIPFTARLVGGPDDGQARHRSTDNLLPMLGSSTFSGGYWPTTERNADGEVIYRYRAEPGTESPTYDDLRHAMFDRPSAWPSIHPDVNERNQRDLRDVAAKPATGFHLLEPEVPGELGEETELEPRPDTYPLVGRVHFEFGYLGRDVDDLFTSHPVYLVTGPLADALRASNLTGFVLREGVLVTVDPQVAIVDPGWRPPAVVLQLEVPGSPGSDDFGLTSDARLVVSQAALGLLQAFRIANADIERYG
jgi:hypothetical protein